MDEGTPPASRGPTWVDGGYRWAFATAIGLLLAVFALGAARAAYVTGGLPGLKQEPLSEVRPLLAAGRAPAAAREIHHAVALNGDYATLVQGGRALAELGDMAQAEAALTKAARLRPDRAEPWTTLGWAWLGSGRLEPAAGAFSRAVRLEACAPLALAGLGEVALDRNDLEGARVAFEAALRCQPANAEAHNGLGIVLALQKKPAAAVPHFEQAVRIAPTAQLRANLARARAAAQATTP